MMNQRAEFLLLVGSPQPAGYYFKHDITADEVSQSMVGIVAFGYPKHPVFFLDWEDDARPVWKIPEAQSLARVLSKTGFLHLVVPSVPAHESRLDRGFGAFELWKMARNKLRPERPNSIAELEHFTTEVLPQQERRCANTVRLMRQNGSQLTRHVKKPPDQHPVAFSNSNRIP